ncbi:AAA family ATPase [Desulfobacter curvatus]|uniref:AAA family ATPase n=1 Tax=Desulfobacter curvatus TaxID=2290 RepID=UPI00037AC717|nr:AAA family ATPase [Desulfobacter curvatus]
MGSAVKHEFFRWIETLNSSKLTDIDCKLLNLLVNNFDTLAPLTTVRGSNNRATKINELIQKHHATLSSEFPDILSQKTNSSQKLDRITELKIGPFRGFATGESFTFDKRYTFMYGPNGSGKSSFCEGLEYALLGRIEEATAKRIAINDYIRNTKNSTITSPSAYTTNSDGQRVQITQNESLYRFAFIEKNRIDGFARITATTASSQKDRIATLFGLDEFSAFVDGFTDDFEKYTSVTNEKAEAFKGELKKYEDDKKRIIEIDSELSGNAKNIELLIKDVAQTGVKSADDLKQFLNGTDGVSGHIGMLQQKKAEQISDDLKTEAIDNFQSVLLKIDTSLKSFNTGLDRLKVLSSDVNFKDLYSAIESIGSIPEVDLSHCPACKTPIGQVVVNPFENAKAELGKLLDLSELQKRVSETGTMISKDVRNAIAIRETINELGKSSEYAGSMLPVLTEFDFTNIGSIDNWKSILESELLAIGNQTSQFDAIKNSVLAYNTKLSEKRERQQAVDSELKKYQDFNTRVIELIANEKKLAEEKVTNQKAVDDFSKSNTTKLKEIEDENKRITINKQYVEAYNRLIKNLKLTRNQLPSKLSTGLSEKVKEYYNIINAHDPEFELLDSLALPAKAGAKFEIKFKADSRIHDALYILSEGHIKVLGLSILLAKAINENLGFLIFDDIVNAIDDDHRSGIADLLIGHSELKNRQYILTCHGETFINKLEHKLGASLAGKHVKSYRFIPADTVSTRGVQVSIGNSKHYLLKANESFKQNDLKDSATDCRRAVESISYQLWKKLDKRLKINLKVTMRAPGVQPDLASVADSLIKELGKVNGLEKLHEKFSSLKAKYPWSLLNKGVHEDENQPEFERKDISELITLLQSIEENVSSLKLVATTKEAI